MFGVRLVLPKSSLAYGRKADAAETEAEGQREGASSQAMAVIPLLGQALLCGHHSGVFSVLLSFAEGR